MLAENSLAPDFVLKNQNGEDVRLSDFRGKKVVLYFYSKDNTSGCTRQACGFASLHAEFEKKGAVVVGISKDSFETHKKFEQKYGLNFILLSDEEKSVLQAYDVWKEKNMYGKKVMGTVRTTYLIDENGIIIKAKQKVKPEENPPEVLGWI